jgi:DNA-binding NarL/FixJ family response regulator
LGRKYITPEISEKLLLHVDTGKNPHELLTNKELEIFKLLAYGKTITQIAEMHSLALTTVSTHRSRILEKLNLSTNSELTRYAIAHHIISDIEL